MTSNLQNTSTDRSVTFGFEEGFSKYSELSDILRSLSDSQRHCTFKLSDDVLKTLRRPLNPSRSLKFLFLSHHYVAEVKRQLNLVPCKIWGTSDGELDNR